MPLQRALVLPTHTPIPMTTAEHRPMNRPASAPEPPVAPVHMEATYTVRGSSPADRIQDAGGAGSPALPRHRYLFGRWVDLLGLGGASLIVLVALALLFPEGDEPKAMLAATMLFLAHFVNHPHFAHSYQIFYDGFTKKAFSPESVLASRYILAGVVVPAVLVAYFALTLAQGSAALLGLAANVMFFTVGWHYAKQGYGILMVDAARSKVRFSPGERRRLVWNTHLTWVSYWLLTNDAFAEKDYWGLTYYTLDVPDPILVAMFALVAVSTLLVARDFLVKWRAERTLPLNGLVAYVAAIYIWLFVARIDPVLILVVPFFHSLQYLVVVWRYQLNVESDTLGRQAEGAAGAALLAWVRSAPVKLARFMIAGGILGALGFWWAPVALDTFAGYDRAVFGTTAFLFMAWTFINIHHYFIDNVIWRRENPEIRRHLLVPATATGPGR